MNTTTLNNGTRIEWSFRSESENTEIHINEEGNFDYIETPVRYAVFTFKVNDTGEFTLAAQFDCGDRWTWYNMGGDGETSEQTARHFFDSEDSDLVEFLDTLLNDSEPDVSISLEQRAECLRDSLESDNELFKLAANVQEICSEKSADWCLVTAFWYKNGLDDAGAWECFMQVKHGLSKSQTLELTRIFN